MKHFLLLGLGLLWQMGFAQTPAPKFEVWNKGVRVNYEEGISLPTQNLVLAAKDIERYRFKIQDFQLTIVSEQGLAIKSFRGDGNPDLLPYTKMCRPGRVILIEIKSYKIKNPDGQVKLIKLKNWRVIKFAII